MRTTVIAVLVAVSLGVVDHGDASAGARQKARRVKTTIARHTPRPVKSTIAAGRARLQRTRQASARRRDVRRGKALAEVQRYGHTRIRSLGDLLYSPALHGAVAFAGMLSVGMKGTMALIAGGLVYASSRAAKKTSDGWLALENKSISVLEREGPAAAADRLRHQGAREPEAGVKNLQKNRHLRNGSYE
jgi:hypothetical protein